MKRIQVYVSILITLISVILPQKVEAAAGAPGSADFGYGVWLHPDGAYFDEGLSLIDELQPDWLAVELNWARWMPEHAGAPDFSAFDQVIRAADAGQTAVMISLTNPPAWALTSQGPSAVETARVIALLAGRYPGTLQAVELFPAANTTAGWGAAPNPDHYARFYSETRRILQNQGVSLILAAGGLAPADSTQPGSISDLDFLRGLYSAGAAQWMDVLSLRFDRMSGSPLTAPGGGRIYILRHYEDIRQIMLECNHQSGLIWITLLSAPDGTIESGDRVYRDAQRQTEWLQQAVLQIRSQLYIGAVFAHHINPPGSSGLFSGEDAFLLKPNSFHPFYSVFKAIIQQAHPQKSQQDSGRPKDGYFLKSKYKT